MSTLVRNELVEFIGLPGAGKTALAQAVFDDLKVAGLPFCGKGNIFIKTNKAAIWFQALLYYCKNIKIASYYLIYTIISTPAKPKIIYYNLGRYFELLKIIYIIEIRRSEINNTSTILLDQGILQCIWSITSRGGKVNKNFLKKCMATSNHIYPGRVVFVKVEAELAAGRIANRNSKCVFDHLPLLECIQLFSNQEINCKIIIEALEEITDAKKIIVDGGKYLNENTGLIYDFITKP